LLVTVIRDNSAALARMTEDVQSLHHHFNGGERRGQERA
jgi:hypothetical protein